MFFDPSETVRIKAHPSLSPDKEILIGQTARFLRYSFPEGHAVVELRCHRTQQIQRFNVHPECLSKE